MHGNGIENPEIKQKRKENRFTQKGRDWNNEESLNEAEAITTHP